MAITIISQPTSEYTPVFNKVLFQIVSDQVTNTGFRYVARIRNLNTNTIIATTYYDRNFILSQPIEVDVSHFLQGYFDYYKGLFAQPVPDFSGCGWRRDDNLVLKYRIEFFEYYDSDFNGVREIVLASQVNSDTFNAVPFCFSNYEIGFFDSANIDLTNYPALTDFRSIKMLRSSFYSIAFLDPFLINGIEVVEIASMTMELYDQSNTLIQTIIAPLTTIPTLNQQNVYFLFRADFLNLNTKKVKLKLNYTLNGILSQSDIMNIELIDCYRNTTKTLYFLNKYGAFDSYSFTLNNTKTFEIQRERYKRFYDGTGYIEDAGLFRFRNTTPVYHSRLKKRMMFMTNWLSDSESVLLEQLFSSSVVYLLDNDNADLGATIQRGLISQPSAKLIPVTIRDTTYEEKYSRAHRNFQYMLNIDFSEQDQRQVL
jgi:hypothetical protein